MSKKDCQPPCNFCGNKSSKKYEIKRFQKPFNIFKCNSCGLLFQHPIILPEQIKEFYDKDYYSGKKDFSYEDERSQYRYYSYVFRARIKKIKKFLKTESDKKKILDIGCSFGGLLLNAEEKGFTGFGIEISDYSRKYANGLFKERIFKNFKEADFKDSFFDCITMIEVIEHLDDPGAYLEEIFRILKKNGICVIQTANIDGIQAKKAGQDYHYFLPGHLFYFSKSNLRKKLKETGFSKIKFFHPVEFGLIPKLRKAKGNFFSIKDYSNWLRIIWYHLKSYIYFKDFCLTSSMVVYAWK